MVLLPQMKSAGRSKMAPPERLAASVDQEMGAPLGPSAERLHPPPRGLFPWLLVWWSQDSLTSKSAHEKAARPSFFFNCIYLFIYLWLCWVLVSV